MTDFRDLMLKASADVQRLFMSFEQELQMPMVKGQMGELWATLPDEMKERFKQERPEEYHALMSALKEGE